MTRRPAKQKEFTRDADEKLLTEVELELMTILWKLGEGTVAAVIEALPPGRDLAYTSVSTVLRILEQKRWVTARKEGRGHVYVPRVPKEQYEEKAVRHVVDRVFDGGPVALVKQLLNAVNVSQSDLEELKALIARAEERK